MFHIFLLRDDSPLVITIDVLDLANLSFLVGMGIAFIMKTLKKTFRLLGVLKENLAFNWKGHASSTN